MAPTPHKGARIGDVRIVQGRNKVQVLAGWRANGDPVWVSYRKWILQQETGRCPSCGACAALGDFEA